MENTKYEFTEEVFTLDDGREAYRIRALKDFGDVKAGDLGGLIEGEYNLSYLENDLSWVYDDSVVVGQTDSFSVSHDAHIRGESQIDRSTVRDSNISNKSEVTDSEISQTVLMRTYVTDSVMNRTHTKDSVVERSNIKDSQLEDQSNIYDSPKVEDVFVEYVTLSDMKELKNSRLFNSSVSNSIVEDSELNGSTAGHSEIRNGSGVNDSHLWESKVDHSFVKGLSIRSEDLSGETRRANNKFELSENGREIADGVTVYRIRALADFSNVKVGDLGGYVEKEVNLSFEEDDHSWVYDESVVSGVSEVSGDSVIRNHSSVRDSLISHDTLVSDQSYVQKSDINGSSIELSTVTDVLSYASVVSDSKIDGSWLDDTVVADSNVFNSQLEDSKVREESVLTDTHLENERFDEVQLTGYDSRLQLDAVSLEELDSLDLGDVDLLNLSEDDLQDLDDLDFSLYP